MPEGLIMHDESIPGCLDQDEVTSVRVRDLNFSDIYLGQEECWLAGFSTGSDSTLMMPEAASADAKKLREFCKRYSESTLREEFTINYDGVTYRVSTIASLSEVVFVLRRFPDDVPELEKLGIHPMQVRAMLDRNLSGLVVVAGSFGQGKTTTASAMVKSRLSSFGGIAVTIEDPPEMPLEGRHGKGVCFQTQTEQGGFGHACRQAARWSPSIIFIGEVRDSEAAIEAMKASVNGRLVICTMHADRVISAIERLYGLATSSGTNPDDVSSLLANGLAGVLHQKLEGDPKRIVTEFLWMFGMDNHGARQLIRTRKFEQLGSEITLQQNRMKMSGVHRT